MGYIDHIHACNNHDLSRFVPFELENGPQVGWVRKENLMALNDYARILEVRSNRVILLDLPDKTAAMDMVTRDLFQRGLITSWRDEAYAVKANFSDAAFFTMERTATSFFGVRAFGVHINGYVKRPDGIYMWIAKRASDRAICPGMWDNMVAGGQPAGLGLTENIVKECAEEANIKEELARTARPVGAISYMMETDGGLKPDVMFCYDIEMPEGMTPENTDGEVESFELWPMEKVADVVRETFDFKFNCNLVIMDFLIRHGHINPDNTPNYEALVSGLHA